jgi:hypothetical protein
LGFNLIFCCECNSRNCSCPLSFLPSFVPSFFQSVTKNFQTQLPNQANQPNNIFKTFPTNVYIYVYAHIYTHVYTYTLMYKHVYMLTCLYIHLKHLNLSRWLKHQHKLFPNARLNLIFSDIDMFLDGGGHLSKRLRPTDRLTDRQTDRLI